MARASSRSRSVDSRMQPSPTRGSPAPRHSAAGVWAAAGAPCLVTAAPATADTATTVATIHACDVMVQPYRDPRRAARDFAYGMAQLAELPLMATVRPPAAAASAMARQPRLG